MRLITCILIVLIFLTGCTADKHESKIEHKAKITITPVDLFKGEAAKFRPFLGTMSGAFKLRYEGNKPNVNLDVDIWENGQKVSSAGSISDLFFRADTSNELEIMISINRISLGGQDGLNKINISVINNSGFNHVTFTTPWEKELTTQGLIHNKGSYTFIAEKLEYVWGMQATSTNKIHTADLTLDSLSKLEKAIILTLRFED